jgi:hypothetical protein
MIPYIPRLIRVVRQLMLMRVMPDRIQQRVLVSYPEWVCEVQEGGPSHFGHYIGQIDSMDACLHRQPSVAVSPLMRSFRGGCGDSAALEVAEILLPRDIFEGLGISVFKKTTVRASCCLRNIPMAAV